jgi:hypothetical protein
LAQLVEQSETASIEPQQARSGLASGVNTHLEAMKATRRFYQLIPPIAHRFVRLARQLRNWRGVRPDIREPGRQPVICARERLAQPIRLHTAEDPQRRPRDTHRLATVLDSVNGVGSAVPSLEEEGAIAAVPAVAIMVAKPACELVAHIQKAPRLPCEEVLQFLRRRIHGDKTRSRWFFWRVGSEGTVRRRLSAFGRRAHVAVPLLLKRKSRLSKPRVLSYSGPPFRLCVAFDRTGSLNDRPKRRRLSG